MYVSAQPPPVLTVAVPAEISMQHGTESQPLKLAQYQIVQATVAEGGFDKVVLNVRQQKLSADTEVPLKTGQQLNLQVVATKPRIHLRIIEAAELKHLFRLLNSMGSSVRLGPLMKYLQSLTGRQATDVHDFQGGAGRFVLNLPEETTALFSHMARLFQQSPDKLRGEDLAGLWKGLGLDFEALLAAGRCTEAESGLKSLLFKAAAQLEAQGVGTESIERTIEQFNLFQLCRHRLAQEDVFFLPLPFPFLEQGYMLAQRDGGYPETDDDEQSERPWKMTLHLKLSVLGALEIKLLFEKNVLRLRILCDSEQKAEIIGRSMSRLAKSLSTVSLKAFSVDVGAGEPIASLVKRLAPDGEHFLEAQV